MVGVELFLLRYSVHLELLNVYVMIKEKSAKLHIFIDEISLIYISTLLN